MPTTTAAQRAHGSQRTDDYGVARAAAKLPLPTSFTSNGTSSDATTASKKAASSSLRSADVVTAVVVKLCRRVAPSIDDTTIEYCMKILGSRLATGPTVARDTLSVLGKIRKAVERKARKTNTVGRVVDCFVSNVVAIPS